MIYYRWENINKQRYYKIVLSQDLFCDWMLTKAWGSLNNASGRIVHTYFSSYDQAIVSVQKLNKLRKQRGYQLRETNECSVSLPV